MAERSMQFGRLLRQYRIAAGLTQQVVAMRSGLSHDAVSMLERGARRAPRSSTVALLASALRLDPAEREALIAAAQPAPREVGHAAAASSLPSVPRELPAAPPDFVGRVTELATLTDLLDESRNPGGPIAIDGMAGVGKSALAIHAAHQLVDAGSFPDGHLYVNLQGASGRGPLEPLSVLGRLLRTLGLAPAAIPAELDEAAACFRTLTADRRLLVLLDNAQDVTQIRPLLPGNPSCGVLVTSREVLGMLEGARRLHLEVLPPEHALTLLDRIAGRDRVAAESRAAADVTRTCGYLPLAIRIAGARLAAHPGSSLGKLASSLVAASSVVDELQAGDLAVRASFDVSVRGLRESSSPVDARAATAFGLLSLPDGPDLSEMAASALLDLPEPVTETLLDRLVAGQVLEAARPGRYRFHDLVRRYARDEAAREHGGAEQVAALTRTFSFYTATVWRSIVLLRPGDHRFSVGDHRWTSEGLMHGDASAAWSWFELERANLLAAVAQAGRMALDGTLTIPTLSCQLANGLGGFLSTAGHWHDWLRVSETALEVAQRVGDRGAEADALQQLGAACGELGRYGESVAHLERSLSIQRALGDRHREAGCLGDLGLYANRQGRNSEAQAYLEESLAIRHALGDRRGCAVALINLGGVHGDMGCHEQAVPCLREALAIFRQLGNERGAARTLIGLGYSYRELGCLDDAAGCLHEGLDGCRNAGDRQGVSACLNELGVVSWRRGHTEAALEYVRESLATARELGDRFYQANALRDLGDVLHGAGRVGQARASWEEALALSEAMRLSQSGAIRARLSALDS
jgi:tetratricopeptide (TPR) repeat protein/transcriptional regulator with XRE-family HTH domain